MAEGPDPGQTLARSPVTPNLKDLINELKSVSDWYSLGVNLNFQRHQLNEIERNYRGDDKRCKTEMLGFWLDSTTPTWKAVADALRLMEAHMVADNIQRKYITSSTITEVPQVPALSQLAPLSPQREEETKITSIERETSPSHPRTLSVPPPNLPSSSAPEKPKRSRSTSFPPHLQPYSDLQEEIQPDEHQLEEERGEPNSMPCKPKPGRPHNEMCFVGFHKEVNWATGSTVAQLFKSTAERFPMHPALKHKEDGTWETITYTGYYNHCIKAAKSFLKLGLEPKHAVAIIGGNSPEWLISYMGAMFAGGLPAGIYATNKWEVCHFVAASSKANIIVVEDQEQLDKILQGSSYITEVQDRLPHLKAIVQYKGKLSREDPNVYKWEEFLKVGSMIEKSVVEKKIQSQKSDQCALLIYTSGTTGIPQGVMLSHDNLIFSAKALVQTCGRLEHGKERGVSYLPLSHIAAQDSEQHRSLKSRVHNNKSVQLPYGFYTHHLDGMTTFAPKVDRLCSEGSNPLVNGPQDTWIENMTDIYLPLLVGAAVFFAQPDALKGSLGRTLLEVQPTFFFGVPRVYDQIMEQLEQYESSIRGWKRGIFTWAKKKGLKGNEKRQKNQSLPWGWAIAKQMAFKNVREALGFQQCKLSFVGSEPMHRDVHNYFMSINIPLMELYGMSECSGCHTLNLRHKHNGWRVGTCGKPMMGVKLKIVDPDDNKERKEGEEGEICIKGHHVFMGYLDNKEETLAAIDEEKTSEVLDEDGWLHSRDIGKIEDGFLCITGRIKECIIMSTGENIHPLPIEKRIKKEIPFLSNVMVVGDKKKFLTCLMTLKCEIDSTGKPLDTLTPYAQQLIKAHGCQNTMVSEIVSQRNKAVFTAIHDGVDRANGRATSEAERIKEWTLLDSDFSIPGGELGPTLKLRRQFVHKKYETTIEDMYSECQKVVCPAVHKYAVL